jgi:hypothetical protein
MRPKIRALFAAGRFTTVEDGTARFALPNEAHRERCEVLRAEVEEALAAHFGRPVPMTLVVDDADAVPATPPSSDAGGGEPRARRGDAEPAPDLDEESVDVSELEDAGSASTGVDQLAEVFGSVDVVEQAEEGPS